MIEIKTDMPSIRSSSSYLIESLIERNLVEKFTVEPYSYRFREKSMGYMRRGSAEILLRNKFTLSFEMEHHYHDDIGGDWEPKGHKLYEGFYLQFVFPPNSTSGYGIQCILWMEDYICYVDGGLSVERKDAKKLVENGTYIEGKDYIIFYDERN